VRIEDEGRLPLPLLLLLLLLPVTALSCAGAEQGGDVLQLGPMASFEEEVQPILSTRCGSGGCHGVSKRPFSLYSEGVRRIDPGDTYLDVPLTREELEHNARQLAGFAHGVAPAQSVALCKPLANGAGGCWHDADDIFIDETDPDFGRMLRWLESRSMGDGGAP